MFFFVLVRGQGAAPSSSPSHHGQMDGLRKGFDNAPPAEFWFDMLLPPTIFFFLLVVIKMVIASLSPCLLCEARWATNSRLERACTRHVDQIMGMALYEHALRRTHLWTKQDRLATCHLRVIRVFPAKSGDTMLENNTKSFLIRTHCRTK